MASATLVTAIGGYIAVGLAIVSTYYIFAKTYELILAYTDYMATGDLNSAYDVFRIAYELGMEALVSAIMAKLESALQKSGSGNGNGGGSNFRNQDLLDSHYKKHAKEFGDISKADYLNGADNLVNSMSDDILTKTRANGDTIFYNPNSNEFAVKSADGYIRTYFKPSDGIDYFIRQ